MSYNLGYTLTDAYDGEDCDDPDYAKWQANYSQCLDEMPVRVPRHSINASVNNKFSNKINTSLQIKYASERRDYGNGNNGFNDVLLGDYLTVDLFLLSDTSSLASTVPSGEAKDLISMLWVL